MCGVCGYVWEGLCMQCMCTHNMASGVDAIFTHLPSNPMPCPLPYMGRGSPVHTISAAKEVKRRQKNQARQQEYHALLIITGRQGRGRGWREGQKGREGWGQSGMEGGTEGEGGMGGGDGGRDRRGGRDGGRGWREGQKGREGWGQSGTGGVVGR